MSANNYIQSAQYRIPFVKEILPPNGIGAELGVFKGDFSPVLLQYAKPKTLTTLD